MDGPRLKKILKKFNAPLPAFKVSCTSSEVSVEPEVALSPDSDLIAHHMSGNQECVSELMCEEELYNLVAEVEDPVAQ